MNPTVSAFVRSWPWDPWLVIGLFITGSIYLRGWHSLRQRDPQRWTLWHLTGFLGGLLALFLALASPIEPFASLLLQIHMVQHLLLMMVAPPLIWLSEPFIPLLRGVPRGILHIGLRRLLKSRRLQSLLTKVTSPMIALVIMTATTWLWHLPAIYDAALSLPWLHYVQHVSFLVAALIFWYPVVRPYPSRPKWSPWLLLPCLLLADIQNTVLSAILTFSEKPIYQHYVSQPRIAGISALDDQATAGVLMWVPGSVAFLGPLLFIGIRLFDGSFERKRSTPRRRQVLLPVLSNGPSRQFDLLHSPLIGRLLRSRYFRIAVQSLMLLLAVLVVLDGLTGPQLGAMNLAGVLPWIHWRGLLIFGLLAVGNVFCYACPFTLPRRLIGSWLPQGFAWPRWLKGKWIAFALMVLFLWTYEAGSLWDRPWVTAWIVIAYFGMAFLVDSLFRAGTFCKYVCPIGQFNFVQSMISPLEVRVVDSNVCVTCTTHDCIRGNAKAPGCELELFQPHKRGNTDCTFCLDCVQACPRQNVGILSKPPGQELWEDRWRSGIGRISERPDLAALVLLLTFGAFANAAGMVEPIVVWQDAWSRELGQSSHLLMSSLFYLLTLFVIPAVLVSVATSVSLGGNPFSQAGRETATRFAYAFVPIGFAMWLAHYSFHFLTSSETIIPVTQRFVHDLGMNVLGDPRWACACCRPVTNWLIQFEILAMDIGFLGSMYAAWRISTLQATPHRSAWRIFAPWGMILLTLFVVGVWIFFQPMQMRGTLPGAG